mmetsp:Transcript_12249/g.22960  ORF Transcript_12249/g.22960 Transcript_12249/m.22960 type:complete len:394 (+) Transcript_12249:300-1481(+)
MPRPRFDEEFNKSEQTLDVFSHDSTHVRLVLEAEKQSNLARSKAMDILQKYSKDYGIDDIDDKQQHQQQSELENSPSDEDRDDRDLMIDLTMESPYIQSRSQFMDMNRQEDTPQDLDVQSCTASEGEQQKNDVFDEKCEELTQEDLEHIAHCLMPLSPKGLKRNKAKQISGRFEFRRINSGSVSVVKSHRALSIMSPEDFKKQQGGSTAVKNTIKTREDPNEFVPKKGKPGSLRRRFSFSSRSRASKDVDSGIHTDDACLQGTDDESNKKERKQPHSTQVHSNPLQKQVKEGDLPPKPSPKIKPVRRMSMGAPSSRATASDIDYDEVISVVTDMSDISEVSIAEKAKDRGPVVLTEAMLKTAIIPETICLKTQVKLTRIEALKRKFSFSKGKI